VMDAPAPATALRLPMGETLQCAPDPMV
jgi:hypothetical protein